MTEKGSVPDFSPQDCERRVLFLSPSGILLQQPERAGAGATSLACSPALPLLQALGSCGGTDFRAGAQDSE